MDAELKLYLDTTDVERAFDEIDERLDSCSDSLAGITGGTAADPVNDPAAVVAEGIDHAEILNRIMEKMNDTAGVMSEISDTMKSIVTVLEAISKNQNSVMIQPVQAVP